MGDVPAFTEVVPRVRRDFDLSEVRAEAAGRLRVSEAFPRKPAPRHIAPSAEEILRAREEYALHIPSLFVPWRCLAESCEEEWPCPPYRRAVAFLERAGQFDVNGQLRPYADGADE